jgi:hypothetical protein
MKLMAEARFCGGLPRENTCCALVGDLGTAAQIDTWPAPEIDSDFWGCT